MTSKVDRKKIQDLKPEIFYTIFLWWHSSLCELAHGERPGLAFISFLLALATIAGGAMLAMLVAAAVLTLGMVAWNLLTIGIQGL